jgi:hypothetical protein
MGIEQNVARHGQPCAAREQRRRPRSGAASGPAGERPEAAAARTANRSRVDIHIAIDCE